MPPRTRLRRLAGACLLWSSVVATSVAHAADVTLLCAGAMKPAVSAILAQRGDASPRIVATYATAGAIRDRVAAGDLPDVVVAPSDAMDEFEAQRRVDSASRRALGTTEIGIAVRSGAPRPDVSTPEALRAVLLAARRIVIVDPSRGTSGRLLLAIFRDLGVADAVGPKLMPIDGGMVTEAVARGEADLGFQQVSEILPVQGVTLVGTLPGSLARVTRYDVARTSTRGADANAAAAIAVLTSADARAAIRASGFEVAR